VLAMSGRAVEAAGDVSTLLLDKTGTITYGNRMAAEFLPVGGAKEADLAEVVLLSSLADETPEGRSIVSLAVDRHSLSPVDMPGAELVPFTAQTRMSGIEIPAATVALPIRRDEGRRIERRFALRAGRPLRAGQPAKAQLQQPTVVRDGRRRSIRKGAADSVQRWVEEQGGRVPADLGPIVERIATSGGTPLVVAEGGRVLGVIHLKDTVKTGISEKFAEMRSMGIKTIMVTGDNPLTAAAIAAEAGVDEFMAEATPEEKMARIRREQAGGNLVAMTGDGTNDAPALAQADVGVAMNTGTQAAKEAGNMVDLDSDPTKLMDVVEIGKQLLITRGSLTTFSVANDVAKYFAIVPAMFQGVFPSLKTLNVMGLDNPHSAILSAVIFNAIIIVLLIPLALRGVKFKAMGAQAILRRNILIYGLGGVVAPFVGIKIIDLVLTGLGVH
jgi:K+-transporting ATPase ATPase B chain